MAATTSTEEAALDVRRRRRELNHEADVVVVGGGVLGCALAHALADQGRSVLLLERWLREPDRIVGELMQPGGVAALRRLGLETCLDGIEAVACHGYHVVFDGNDVVIPYPAVDAQGHVPMDAYVGGIDIQKKSDESGAPQGRSFHHGRFIGQLRRRCLAHPNITVVETEVTGLIRGGPNPDEVLGVEARTTVRALSDPTPVATSIPNGEAAAASDEKPAAKKPDCFFGQLTIVADGYGSRFRAGVLGSAPVVKSKFYALELIDCPLEPKKFGHVFISSNCYPVLLYQIGPRETRALIDVPVGLEAASPARGGVRGYIRDVVLPTLPAEVHPCVEAALADGRIPRSMPNSWLPPAPRAALARAAAQGVVLLGDAYNMRHPLTGGGMTVALNDAVLLASLIAPAEIPDLADHRALAAAMAAFHWRRKRLTAIINVLAQALYALFAADAPPQRTLQKGCFAYFERGWAAQPAGLLGGILHRPLVLAYHFFSVAFLAIWLRGVEIVQGTTPSGGGKPSRNGAVVGTILGVARLPLAVWDGILVLWTACVVFLPVFWRELR